jgi:hypothetical protein
MSFWTDPKVDDDFTPEDKYFYLYLLTNPHTNLCGCYEISMRQMVRETGYNEDTVKRLINRMETVHGVIQYDPQTKEIYIPRWGKYNWCNSQKTKDGAVKSMEFIKSEKFKKALSDTLCIPYVYPIYTSDTDTVTVTDSDSVKSKHPTIEDVKAYCQERGNRVDPERFIDYYTANGWKVGKNPMKDWKAAVRTWERSESKMNSKQKDYYDKWHPKCERGGSVAQIEDIELKLEDLE